MATTERSRQPLHSMAFEMTGSTWLTEEVYFADTVSAGNIVCYYGEYAGSYPKVVLSTFGDTTTCLGQSTWSKVAHRKAAGVASTAYDSGEYGKISIAGRVTITKEATSMGHGRVVIMGSTNPGFCTEAGSADILTNSGIGFVAAAATAGDSTVDAYVMPWRV